MHRHDTSLVSRTFKDKKGRLTLFQWPNLPLAGWIICELLASFINEKHIIPGLRTAATAFLAIWAYLEIRQGINYFRIILGAVVGAVIFAGFFA